MPIQFLAHVAFEGISSIPYATTILKTIPWLLIIYVLKRYFGGATSLAERNMHSKVVLVTGGTSGIGAATARSLATRGAQIILLTHHPLTDPFLTEQILDLRAETGNELITAEHCDLASLYSIRKFATKWVDNAPPRRLDMIILCADTFNPPGAKPAVTEDGLEASWGVNYVANFHLLSILSPAIRAQPPHREVRIVFATCASYVAGKLPDFSAAFVSATGKEEAVDPENDSNEKKRTRKKSEMKGRDDPQVQQQQQQKQSPKPERITLNQALAHPTSKLALLTFAHSFQKHLSSTPRPDTAPSNARVLVVDPGFCRTPGMRRYLSRGTILGLLLYLLSWPLWWLVLKSPEQGAQSFLHAALDAAFGRGDGPWFVKECGVREIRLETVRDEKVQGDLWRASERTVEALEREGVVRRAREKKEEGKKVSEKDDGERQDETTPGSRRSPKA